MMEAAVGDPLRLRNEHTLAPWCAGSVGGYPTVGERFAYVRRAYKRWTG